MLNWIVLKEQIIYIKMDLALNSLQRLICHKTQQTKPNLTTSMNFFKLDDVRYYLFASFSDQL